MAEPKWNITYRRKEPSIVVEEMSAADIAKFFPDHVRAELTGRFKALKPEDELASTILDRAAHS
jgi:hypothetical protein